MQSILNSMFYVLFHVFMMIAKLLAINVTCHLYIYVFSVSTVNSTEQNVLRLTFL